MDPTKKRKLDENGAADNLSALTAEDTRKIIEPFTHEQLLEIVQSAALRHVEVLDAVRSIADRDATQRKLFVRGLGWETTSDKLRSLFSTYGDIDEAAVILDKATGKSKGFGFVTYRHVDGAILALKEPSKKIDGRMTVSQLAHLNTTGNSNPNPTQPPTADASRKIYVGNVPYEMTGERLLAHFLSYGEIEEGPLGFDKATGKSKGYALFVYKTPEAARAALVDPVKTIDGAQLNCKFAIPSDAKKGKPMPGGPPAGAPVEVPPQMPPGPGQYGPPGGTYGAYTGGMHGPPPMGHNPMNPGPGGNHPPASSMGGYGTGMGGQYGGSHYGGPGSGGYSGLGPGGVGGGLGGIGSGMSSVGGSRYGLPPSSGGYNESAHYSLSSSGYGGQQHHPPAGTSPGPRGPPGMYHGGPSYY